MRHKIFNAVAVGVFADKQQGVVSGQFGKDLSDGVGQLAAFEAMGRITVSHRRVVDGIRVDLGSMSTRFSSMLSSLSMSNPQEPGSHRPAVEVIGPSGLSRGEERFLHDVGDGGPVVADQSRDVPPHAIAVVFEQQRPGLSIAGLQSASDGVLVPRLSQAEFAG